MRIDMLCWIFDGRKFVEIEIVGYVSQNEVLLVINYNDERLCY